MAAVPALAVEELKLAYGGVAALDGVSFDVPAATVTGLIGPNGAGKTTLFNVVSGLARQTSGSVRLFGRSMGHAPRNRQARLWTKPALSRHPVRLHRQKRPGDRYLGCPHLATSLESIGPSWPALRGVPLLASA